MKYFLSLFLTLMLALNSYTQNKDKVNIYLNDDLEKIGSDEFHKKKKSYLFHEKVMLIDSFEVHILRNTEKFGHISKSNRDSLTKEIINDYGIRLKSNETLIIHFRDSLLSYLEFKKRRKPHYIHKMRNGDTLEIRISKKRYLKRKKKFDESIQKCHDRSLKYDAKHLYLYRMRSKTAYTYKNLKLNKINSLINDLFFNGFSGMIILRPDGNYYRYGESSDKKIIKMIKQEDWTDLIADYNKNLTDLPILRKGANRRSSRSSSFKIPASNDKEKIRDAFERHENSYPINIECYSIGY
ncbi:hypothetical protein BWZ20_14255 [Winogradskyella sp. J14-2]|uniref:hypothetical protein n=1 Tax=Winogradskyella sp. J14-2 TaxID=1936080 RepID=UPI000972DCC0|nr:hypothetical protein [Winogradskyella sp. J14-2]APY09397.1 hypothetical protein BWZ20_14255 [Winogradskyella sp. J14-2]